VANPTTSKGHVSIMRNADTRRDEKIQGDESSRSESFHRGKKNFFRKESKSFQKGFGRTRKGAKAALREGRKREAKVKGFSGALSRSGGRNDVAWEVIRCQREKRGT